MTKDYEIYEPNKYWDPFVEREDSAFLRRAPDEEGEELSQICAKNDRLKENRKSKQKE